MGEPVRFPSAINQMADRYKRFDILPPQSESAATGFVAAMVEELLNRSIGLAQRNATSNVGHWLREPVRDWLRQLADG